MGFNLGAFAGGVSQGAMSGLRIRQGLQDEKDRELKRKQEEERFQWEREAQETQRGIRQQRQQLATDMQHGRLDTSGVDAGAVSQQTGLSADRISAMAQGNPQAFDASAGPALPGGVRKPMSQQDTANRVAQLAFTEGNYDQGFAAQDRAKAAEVETLFAAGVKRFSEDPEYAAANMRWVNQGSKRITALPGKDGYMRLAIVGDNGDASEVKLSKADSAKVAGAVAIMDVAPARALEIISGVNKELAAVVAAENGMTSDAATKNNQAQHYANQDAFNRARLSVSQRQLGLQERQLRMGQVRQYQDPTTGEIKEFYPEVTAAGVRWLPVDVPQGMAPYRAPRQLNPADVAKYAETLVGQPTGQLSNGKPVLHTPETAYQAAFALMSSAGGPSRQAIAIDPSQVLFDDERPAAPAQPQAPGPQRLGPMPADLEALVRRNPLGLEQAPPQPPQWAPPQPVPYGIKRW